MRTPEPWRERRALMWHCEHRGQGHFRAAEGYQQDVCRRPTEGRCPICQRTICEPHQEEHVRLRHGTP